MTLLTFLCIIVFLIGLYFYTKAADPNYSEGLRNNTSSEPRCPNLLIQKGSNFYLYNSKLAKVPGVNPIEFDNLEDYSEFLDWQRSQNIRCPVLYLQESYDTQGNRVFRTRPSVSEPQAGLPPFITAPLRNDYKPSSNAPIGIASQEPLIMESSLGSIDQPEYPNPTLLIDATRNNPPYNNDNYPPYDETSFYIGTTTPLDAMNIKQEASGISPNAMHSNWGGSQFTEKLIDNGYFQQNK
jgi:hypothetical protein